MPGVKRGFLSTGFPVRPDRVPDVLVFLAGFDRYLDRRGEDVVIEPAAHTIDDLGIERLVGLQLAADRLESFHLRAPRPLLGTALPICVTFPVGLLPITSPGHDLGQPDSVALGLVLRSPFVEGLEPVDLGEDIEAPDRFQGSSWIGGMQLNGGGLSEAAPPLRAGEIRLIRTERSARRSESP
jgi:hypothetical protein